MSRSRFVPRALLVLGVLAAYAAFRVPLIASIYAQRTLQPLNGLIRHQETHPVEYYLHKTDAAFLKTAFIAVLFYFLWRTLRVRIPDTTKRCFLFFMGALLVMILSSRPNGSDCAQHLAYFAEALEGFANGSWRIFFSRRLIDAPGLPVFVFYSPWNYIVPAAFHSLKLDPFLSLKITFCVLYAVHTRFVYLILKKVVSPLAAAGAFLYVTSNYFLGEYFTRFAFAEFGGYTFCVIGFYFLLDVSAEHRNKNLLLGAVGWGAALVLHPISFAYFYPGAAMFLLAYNGDRRFSAGRVLRSAAGLAAVTLTALAAGSFHWLPIMVERAGVVGNSMRLSDSFRFPGALLDTFNFISPGIVISSILALVTVRAALEIGKKRTLDGIMAGSFVCIVFYLFFMSQISDPLHVGVMRDSQLSWRMLMPFNLFAVIFVARTMVIMHAPAAGSEKIRRWMCAVLLLQGFSFVLMNAAPVLLVPSDDAADKMLWDFRHQKTDHIGLIEFLPAAKNISSDCEVRTVLLDRHLIEKGERLTIRPVARTAEYCLDRIGFRWLSVLVADSPRPIRINREGLIVVPLNEGERHIDILETKPFYVSISEKISLAVFAALLLGLVLNRRSAPAQ